jgi:RsmE family RNA methyltransferase
VNRILFEPDEIADGVAAVGGVRAEHILSILHGEIGQRLKTGVIGGAIGTGEIVSIDGAGTPDCRVSVRVTHETTPQPSWVDLVLAPPRPRVLKRLLPQLAALGVGRITLVGARKVEKDFWGATLLNEHIYRPLLVDGLMQCGVSTELPVLETVRNFRRWVRDELDVRHPATRRFVAHPYGAGGVAAPGPAHGRLLLAVGPEGGWTEDEVTLLEEKGFARCSLGSRILRTDTALIALLARFLG